MITRTRTNPRGLLTTTILAGWLGVGAASAQAQQPASRLVLQIHEVKCLDETNKRSERLGGDEIALTGVAIGPDSGSRPLKTVKIGYFKKDGVEKVFRPTKVVASFNLRKAGAFPRPYQTMLILVERDQGKSLDGLVDGIAKAAKVAPLATGEPLTAAMIAAAAGSAMDAAKKQLKDWFGDDPFPPQIAEFSIPSATFSFSHRRTHGPIETVVVKGNDGKYRIKYSWGLVP